MVKRRALLVGLLVILGVAGYVMYIYLTCYNGFTTKSTVALDNTQRTSYVKAFDNLLCYNPDGVSLMSFAGDVKWSVGFEMKSPKADRSGEYALVYDRRGSMLELVNSAGGVCKVSTSYPITTASVCESGNIAVMMQQEDTAYISIYDNTGMQIAAGALHSVGSGYPLSLSMSSDGQMLAVATLHLSEADVKTEILFYSLSKSEDFRDSNKVAEFSYTNEIIPIIDFVEGDRLIAFGGNGVEIFTPGTDPKLQNEVFFSSEVKSVFHNDNYFGIIREDKGEDGQVSNRLDVYNMSGNQQYTMAIADIYSSATMLDNGEACLLAPSKAYLYTTYGVKKLDVDLEVDLADIIPGNGMKDYYFIQNGQLLNVNLEK